MAFCLIGQVPGELGTKNQQPQPNAGPMCNTYSLFVN